MVAELNPSRFSKCRATACDETGSPVAMYISMIAVSTSRSRGLTRNSCISVYPRGNPLYSLYLQRKTDLSTLFYSRQRSGECQGRQNLLTNSGLRCVIFRIMRFSALPRIIPAVVAAVTLLLAAAH